MMGALHMTLADVAVHAESAQDALGNEDPFAVLDATKAGNKTATDNPAESGHEKATPVKTEGSVYLRNIQSDLNQDSRINPGNRVTPLEENRTVLETRLTLSDNLDAARKWRWLFKGFGLLSSDRETDGNRHQEMRVDELFVDWKGESWFASLGKRRINWGHAQAFNPVNVVVPPREALDPSRETEGQPMFWASRAAGPWSADLVLTRNYDRNYVSDQNRWGLKWNFAARKSDYALYYFDGERYPDGRDHERMLGGSFSADIYPGVTLYSEAARFEHNYRHYYDTSGGLFAKDDPYWQVVIGTGLNLGGRRQVTVEYYSNAQGYTSAERANYLLAAETQIAVGTGTSIADEFRVTGMNRGYVLVGYQDEIRERLVLNVSALMPGDQSYSLRLQGKYALSDYYELRLVLLHNAGTRDSEFGNSPVASAVELGLSVGF